MSDIPTLIKPIKPRRPRTIKHKPRKPRKVPLDQVKNKLARDLNADPIPIMPVDQIGLLLRAIMDNTTADLISIEYATKEIFQTRDANKVKRAVKAGRVRSYKIADRVFVSRSDCVRDKDNPSKGGRPFAKQIVVCAVCGKRLTRTRKKKMVLRKGANGSWGRIAEAYRGSEEVLESKLKRRGVDIGEVFVARVPRESVEGERDE